MNENVAESLYDEITLEPDFLLLGFTNETAEYQLFKREVSQGMVQFHFAVSGNSSFSFNEDSYRLPLGQENALLLYNPQRELPISVQLQPGARVISLLLSIERLHAMFSTEAGYIPFLSQENRQRKYYSDTPLTPALMVVLNQLLGVNLHPSVRPLYYRAKALEILSLYFNRSSSPDIDRCPFLADESNVSRIRQAKEIVVNRLSDPPTLKELAKEVQLPLNRLKEGFKQVYGDTVFGFLLDYKMEVARQMLASGDHNVNEVGHAIGYSTASHFIAAFKKKYGSTPKRFVMNLSGNASS